MRINLGRLFGLIVLGLLSLQVAPAEAGWFIRFAPTVAGYTFTADAYGVFMPAIGAGRPGIDFPVGRTSTNPLRVAYDASSTPLQNFTTTSLTAKNTGTFTGIAINRAVYPGDLENGASLTLQSAGTPGVFMMGTVQNYLRPTGTFDLSVANAAGVGQGLKGYTTKVGTIDNVAHSDWQLVLHIPANASVLYYVPATDTTLDTLTFTAQASGQTISDWDFRNVAAKFAIGGTVFPGYRTIFDQCLFETANMPISQYVQSFFNGTAPYGLTNAEVQFNFKNYYRYTMTVTAQAAAGGNAIQVDAVPADILAAMPEAATNGSPDASGNSYRGAVIGKFFVVDIDNPAFMAKARIINADAGASTITLEYDKDNSDYVRYSPNPKAPIYTTIPIGDRIAVYYNPRISTMFSGRATLIDNSRITTHNDFYATGGIWAFDGYGTKWTNNVITAAGTNYYGEHGDWYQSYSEGAFNPLTPLSTKPWDFEIANNIYAFTQIPGMSATGVSVARDIFIWYMDGYQNANVSFHDNLVMGNLYNQGTYPMYVIDLGYAQVYGITNNGNGKARVWFNAIDQGNPVTINAGHPWQLTGVPGTATTAGPLPYAALLSGATFGGVMANATTAGLSSANTNTIAFTAATTFAKGDFLTTAADSPIVGLISDVSTDTKTITLDTPLAADLASGAKVYKPRTMDFDMAWTGNAYTGPVTSKAVGATAIGASSFTVADASKLTTGMLINLVQGVNPSVYSNNRMNTIKTISGNTITPAAPLYSAVADGQVVTFSAAIKAVNAGFKKIYNNQLKYMGPTSVATPQKPSLLFPQPVAPGVSIYNNSAFSDEAQLGAISFTLFPFSGAPGMDNLTSYNAPVPAPTGITVAAVANDNAKLLVGMTTAAGALGTQYTTDGSTWCALGTDGLIRTVSADCSTPLAANTNYPVQLRSMVAPNSLGVPVVDGPASAIVYGKTGS